TAGEQRGAVRTRQNADLGEDRTHRLDVAAVDADAVVENVPTHDLGFEIVEYRTDFGSRRRIFVAFRRELGDDRIADLADSRVAIRLLLDLVGLAQILFGDLANLGFERRIVDRLHIARLFRRLFRKADDGVDHRLEAAMAEHHGAE